VRLLSLPPSTTPYRREHFSSDDFEAAMKNRVLTLIGYHFPCSKVVGLIWTIANMACMLAVGCVVFS